MSTFRERVREDLIRNHVIKEADLPARLLTHKERPATMLEREAAARIIELESFAIWVKQFPISADIREMADAVLGNVSGK